MPTKKRMTLLARAARRVVWESYIAQARFRVKMWDTLFSESARQLLAGSRVMHRELPPVLTDDAILHHPAIDPTSLFTPVFTKPGVEYFYRIARPTVMEPEFGFLILPPASLMFESVALSEKIRSRKTMVYCSALPSLTSLLLAKANRLPIRRERAIAPMRFVFEPNYYHFLQDTLPRLALLDQYGVAGDVPLVVSPKIAATRFFAEITRRGSLKKRRWLVQDGFFIEADEAFIARTSEGNREQLDHLMDLMEIPRADPSKRRRIFLTRDIKKRGRGIVNMAEIAPVLAEFDLETIDTDHLSFDEQVRLFGETSLVVAIHGAGLTNIMFRRGQKLDLVEIFAPGETPLYYYILARTFGYGYAFVKGMNADGDGMQANFEVDPAALRSALHGAASARGGSS